MKNYIEDYINLACADPSQAISGVTSLVHPLCLNLFYFTLIGKEVLATYISPSR